MYALPDTCRQNEDSLESQSTLPTLAVIVLDAILIRLAKWNLKL